MNGLCVRGVAPLGDDPEAMSRMLKGRSRIHGWFVALHTKKFFVGPKTKTPMPLSTKQRFGHFDIVIKVVAAFAALIPFLGSLVQLKEKFAGSEKMQMMFDDSRFLLVACFGISYAATNDVPATLIAVVLANVILGVGNA